MRRLTWTLTALVLSGACDHPTPPSNAPRRGRAASAAQPLITFGFLERSKPALQDKRYRPLMNYLDQRTPFRFRVLLGTNSERVIGFLEEGLADVVQLGGLSYVEARRQTSVKPLAKPLNRQGQPSCRSAFVTRQGSPIMRLKQLKGATVALGPHHSTLSRLIPLYELAQAGTALNQLRLEFLSDEQAVAKAVLEARVDAGAVGQMVASRYAPMGLRTFHLSGPVPSAPLVIREDLPEDVIRSLQNALLSIDYAGAQRRQAWNERIRYGFVLAADEDYEPLRTIVRHLPAGCGRKCHGDAKF